MGNTESNASIKLLYANYSSVRIVPQHPLYGDGKIIQDKQTREQYFQREVSMTDEEQFKKSKILCEKKMANQHPNLINLIKTFYSQDDQFCSKFFKVYLILEYIPQTIHDLIEKRSVKNEFLAENELWSTLISAIEGLAHIQQIGQAHQNIRPETLSVADMNVKVIDAQLGSNITTLQLFYQSENAYQWYLSPALLTQLREEVIGGHNPFKSDVFSLGMVMLHLSQLSSCDECYNYPGFQLNLQVLLKRLIQLEQDFSPQFASVVKSMLQLNEDNRPDFLQLRNEISQLTMSNYESKEDIIEISAPKTKKYIESNTVYETFNQSKPMLQEVSAIPEPNIQSAKFASSVQLRQSLQNIQEIKTQSNARLGTVIPLKQDPIDHNKHVNIYCIKIFISEKPSILPEPDQNQGNQIIIGEPDDDYTQEDQYEQEQIPDQFLNSREYQEPTNIFPVSYDSYKVQRDTHHYEQHQHVPLNKNQYSALSENSIYKRSAQNYQSSLRKEKCVEMYQNGSRYEGEKLNGMRHGYGCFFYQDEGGVYEGQWFENKMHGQGTLFYASGKPAYEGQWANDKFEGQGVLYNKEPQMFYNEFDYRDFDKVGEFWSRYQGGFHNDNREGNGVLYLSNGERLEAYFLGDLVCGPGTFYSKNGQITQGRWWQNKLQ